MAHLPIVIRPVRPDHPEVVALLGELDAYLASLYEPEANHILNIEALLSSDVTFLAAWQHGRVLGCGAARRMPPEAHTGGRGYGEIKRMMVQPAMRGQRIGEQILAALESALRAEGITQALLETGELQRAALRLYERCGYRRRPAFGGYPDNGLSLFLEKRLAP
jgi:putative acetyltransferase